MAFSVTHRATTDRNIRHIYSGLPTDIRFRTYGNSLDSALDIHDRVREQHRRRPVKFEHSYQEFSLEYNARLPKAPAFRHLSSDEVGQITSRLSQPTLMSILRQKAPSGRSTSLSAKTRSDRNSNSECRQDSEKRENNLEKDRHRKISYKEWSDDESGYYYIDESEEHKDVDGDESEAMEKAVDAEISTAYIEDAGNHGIPINNDNKEKYGSCDNENEDSEMSASSDSDDERQVQQKTKRETQSDKTNGVDQKHKRDVTDANDIGRIQKRKKQPNKRLTILEEIMQLKSSRPKRVTQQTSYVSPTPQRRKLESRGRVDNRLVYSPYSEPAPKLRNDFTIHNPAKISRRNWRDPNQSFPANHTQRAVEPQKISHARMRTGTSWRCDNSSKKTTPMFERSKSAPAYKTFSERGELNKKTLRENTKTPTGTPIKKTDLYLYNGNNCFENSGRCDKDNTTHQTNTSKNEKRMTKSLYPPDKSNFTNEKSRSKSSVSVSSNRSTPRSSMAATPTSSDRNDTLRRSKCCVPAVENDFLLRFDIKPMGNRPFIAGDMNSCKRYSSFVDMEKANTRLMAPTTAKLIRDRMRYAPDNEKDLMDPVRVVHEETRGKRHCNKRGSLDRNSSEEEEKTDDEEEKKDKDTMKVGRKERCEIATKNRGSNEYRTSKHAARKKYRQQRVGEKTNSLNTNKSGDQKRVKRHKRVTSDKNMSVKDNDVTIHSSTELNGRKIQFEEERIKPIEQVGTRNEKQDENIKMDYADHDDSNNKLWVSKCHENKPDQDRKSLSSPPIRSRSSSKSRSRSDERRISSRNSSRSLSKSASRSRSRSSSRSRSRSSSRSRSRSNKSSRSHSKESIKSYSSSCERRSSEIEKRTSESYSKADIRSEPKSNASSRSGSQSSCASASIPRGERSRTLSSGSVSPNSSKADEPRGTDQQHTKDNSIDRAENNINDEKSLKKERSGMENQDNRTYFYENEENSSEANGQRSLDDEDVFSNEGTKKISRKDGTNGYAVLNNGMIRGHENSVDDDGRGFDEGKQRYDIYNSDGVVSDVNHTQKPDNTTSDVTYVQNPDNNFNYVNNSDKPDNNARDVNNSEKSDNNARNVIDVSDVNDAHKPDGIASDVNDSHKPDDNASDVNDAHKPDDNASDVNDAHKPDNIASYVYDAHKPDDNVSDVNDASDVNDTSKPDNIASYVYDAHKPDDNVSDVNNASQ